MHPIFLRLAGRRVVVVGGGAVAERKVRALMDTEADVLVVSPRATPFLQQLASEGRVRWEARPYRPGDLEGAALVYAAAGEAEVNASVRKEAQARGTLINAADDPVSCDFFVPAIVRRGNLTIAVSTDGASPALAKRIREKLEDEFGPEYGEALLELGRLREEARAAGRPLREEREKFEAIVRRLMGTVGRRGPD
ncbi:MAG: bifunctional precorrin-2 dehydrogenase/sirohydrochlorin ferrochelatase [Vicinamibacterales bacterium]